MNKKILIGSIIAVAILVLASFSSAVSKVASDDEFVELDVEFCGLGKKHTVSLTQQEADEVDLLFTDIEQRLSQVETREKAEEIFREAIVELYELGLLPTGISIEQAQKLVTGKFQNPMIIEHMNSINIGIQGSENIWNNLCCLIAGNSDRTHFHSISFRTLAVLDALGWWCIEHNIGSRFLDFLESIIIWLDEHGFHNILNIISNMGIVLFSVGYTFFMFWILYISIQHFSEYSFCNTISFGIGNNPAVGWIKTIGLNGIKEYNGTFYGLLKQLDTKLTNCIYYMGAFGFSGLKLFQDFDNYYYMGSALLVKIGSEQPLPRVP